MRRLRSIVVICGVAILGADQVAEDDAFARLHVRIAQYLQRFPAAAPIVPDTPAKGALARTHLAAAIRSARGSARQGEFITPDVAALLRARLRDVVKPDAVDVLLFELYPLGPPRVAGPAIGANYAAHLALVPPPAIRAVLPPLPRGASFRLLGRDLLLWDDRAAIVIDYVSDALPPSKIWATLSGGAAPAAQ